MTTYKLNTSLLNHLLCVSLYESVFDMSMQADAAEEIAEADGCQSYELVYDLAQNEKCIENALSDIIKGEILPYLKNFGVTDITLGEWTHPREYNYGCDTIALNFTLSDDFFPKSFNVVVDWQDNEAVTQYIADHYKSRPGFLSLCPESLLELGIDLAATRTTNAVGEYIGLLLFEFYGDDKLQDMLETRYNDYANSSELVWYQPTAEP